MNLLKCALGVRAGNFLGSLVNGRGIEIDKNKAKPIQELPPPMTKKQLHMIIGKVNFLHRFIANLFGKFEPLSSLLKLKNQRKLCVGRQTPNCLQLY